MTETQNKNHKINKKDYFEEDIHFMLSFINALLGTVLLYLFRDFDLLPYKPGHVPVLSNLIKVYFQFSDIVRIYWYFFGLFILMMIVSFSGDGLAMISKIRRSINALKLRRSTFNLRGSGLSSLESSP